MDATRRRRPRPRPRAAAVSLLAAASLLAACGGGPSAREAAATDYTPVAAAGWEVSTPADEGVDPLHVAQLYREAGALPHVQGVVVAVNGRIVAEAYFDEGSIDHVSTRDAVTASVTSALVGLAVRDGHLRTDQPMLDLFGARADRAVAQDLRKALVTIGDLLRMRSGFPFDLEGDAARALASGDDQGWVDSLVTLPLAADPGSTFAYSRLSSHLLGVAVQPSSGEDLLSYGRRLLTAIDADVGPWDRDPDG